MVDTSVPVTSGSGNNIDGFSLTNANIRQAVVIGDSSIVNNVAPIQSTDPTSATQGLVVRDVNTSAIVAKLTSGVAVTQSGTFAVYFDQSNPNVKANAGTGTFAVYGGVISGGTDPAGEGPIKIGGVNRTTLPIFADGQRGDLQISTRGALKTTLFANDSTSPVLTRADNADATAPSATANNLAIQSRNTVYNGPTGNWDRMYSGSGLAANALRVVNATDVASSMNIVGVGTANTLSVFIADTGHTLGKVDAGTGTFTVKLDPSSKIAGSDSSLSVYLSATAGTIGVRVGQVDGTVAVYFSQSRPTVLADEQTTASIFTASGSASGVSVSGNTIISPSAAASFKIYAFSVQTTGLVSLVAKFTNGSGGSPVEYWRPLVTSNQTSSTPIGANLATRPAAPLFVTGTSTTLSLVLDTASLVHYSVSYTKESA